MFVNFSDKEIEELKGYAKDFKNEFREKLSVPGKLKFGCEVEFNTFKHISYYKNIIKDNYQVCYDGSGQDVVEVVSPPLKNNKKDWNTLRETLLKLDGAFIKSTVGGHIHYDASIVKDDNIVYMLKLWHVFEDIIYEFSAGEFESLRVGAELYAEKLYDVEYFIDDYENGSQSLDAFLPVRKYSGLNIANHLLKDEFDSDYKNTYEVRVPNGSVDINIWQNNVEFFARFFKYANKEKNHDLIDTLYKFGKMKDEIRNRLFLADLIYDDEESKIRFLNQFELSNKFADDECSRKIYL